MALPDQSTPTETSSRTTLAGLDRVSALSCTQHIPNLLTGVILRLAQEHFANAANLAYTIDFDGVKGLENYIWTKDPKTTGIQIEPVTKWDPTDVQRRPAIYIKRNKWETHKLAINDGLSTAVIPSISGKGAGNIRGEKHARGVIGSHTLFTVAKEGAEAELIAAEVFDYFMSFAPILRQEFNLLKFEVLELEDIKPVKEHQEMWVVPVVVAYASAWTWRLEAQSPFLQKLSLELRDLKR